MLSILRKFHTKLEIVEGYVLETIKSFSNVQPEKVNKNSRFSELGLDSLDAIDLILDLEDKFGVRIKENEVLQIQSVMDAISIFHRYKI